MRRTDREITDQAEILKIVDACDVASLALNDGEFPYVVPLNFGWEERNGKVFLYFHGAKEGTKIDLIKRDDRCAFAMSCDHLYVPGPPACAATFRYSSVCGRGRIEIAEGEERAHALNVIMKHYERESDYSFEEKHLNSVAILKLEVETLSGKRKVLPQ